MKNPFKPVNIKMSSPERQSMGILDDYAVRKDIQTQTITAPVITSKTGTISFDNENLITTGNIQGTELKAYSSSNVNAVIQTTNTNGQAQLLFYNDARNWNIGINTSDEFFIYDATASANRLIISTTGNLTIGSGEAATNYSLTFDGASNNCVLTWDNTNSYLTISQRVHISATLDSYGRLLSLIKTNYDSSAGSTKYGLHVSTAVSTAGADSQYSLLFENYSDADTGTQSGNIAGVYRLVASRGDANCTGTVMPFRGVVYQSGTGTVSNAYGLWTQGYVSNGIAGTITTYIGHREWGCDAEDGTVGTAYNFMGSAHSKDTGTLTNAYGMVLYKQTAGGTINDALTLLGDGDGAEIMLGAGRDASIWYDGTDLIINPKVVGTGDCKISGSIYPTGYKSSDGSAGVSGTFTTVDLKTITIKDGIVTSIV